MLEDLIRRSNERDVFFIFVASIAIVGFWRGVWNLLDRYLLTENFLWSQVASIIGGIILLILLAQLKVKNKTLKTIKK